MFRVATWWNSMRYDMGVHISFIIDFHFGSIQRQPSGLGVLSSGKSTRTGTS